MTEYFVQEDLNQAKKQKRKSLIFYLIMLGVYLAVSVGLLCWYWTLPYKSPTIPVVKWIHFPITVVFVIFSFIYLGIKHKRAKKYYVMANNLINAKAEVSTGSFLEYDEFRQEKEGVDFKALIFIEWNKYKNDFFERKVLVLYDKPFPEIPENANVKYQTQNNILKNYEILE